MAEELDKYRMCCIQKSNDRSNLCMVFRCWAAYKTVAFCTDNVHSALRHLTT